MRTNSRARATASARPRPREEERDRARQRAAGAMGARGVDPLALPAGHIVGLDQRVGERVAFLMAALDQHRAAVLADQVQRGGDRVFLARSAA